jgi:hypothetical protein
MRAWRGETLAAAAWLLLVLGHYWWTVAPGGREPLQHYHLLADALLAGRVSLAPGPPAELLALPNPYDAERNGPWRARCSDCSLFEGRYYLYYGIAPALTLFVPFRMLTGAHLEQRHAALLFFWGAAALQSGLLLFIARRHCPRAGGLTRGLLLLTLAFSNFQPFLLRRVLVYEVPTAASAFFVSGAVACLFLGFAGARPSLRLALLGSVCLGLAVASRPHNVLVAPLLLPLLLLDRPHAARETWRRAGALLLPFAACCAALAAYNQHRFGRVAEFGQSYALAEIDLTASRLVSPENIPPHLALSLLVPPSVDFDFPFFHMYPAWFPELPHPRAQLESTAGAFACVPAAALALLAPLLLFAWRGEAPRRLLAGWATGLLLAGMTVAVFVASHRVTSVRYLPDFCNYLLPAAGIVALLLDDRLAAGAWAWRASFRALLAALVGFGTLVNLAVGLTGYYDQFRKTRPSEYARIEDAFLPLQRLLLRWSGGHGALRLSVRLPAETPSGAETLVRLETPSGEDALCWRRREDGALLFRFHRAGRPPLRSQALPVARGGATHAIELQAGSLYPQLRERVLTQLFPSAAARDPRGVVRVTLDGQVVLEERLDFEPGSARVRLGTPAEACPAAFGGALLGAAQEFP